MKSWKRITLVISVLISGASFFGYWSLNQFNQAFDTLSASHLASTLTASASFKKDASFTSNLAEISKALTSSTTVEALMVMAGATTTATTTSSTVTATTTPVVFNFADLELSFTFPKKGDEVYSGCTYQISWKSSATINALETALVDVSTMESLGTIASGLATDHTTEGDSQNLKWKVGAVRPGAYYIKVSKVNGVKIEFRSKAFEIMKMPKGIGEGVKIKLCRESGM